jgi:DNA-binding transcriptional MerR regulator
MTNEHLITPTEAARIIGRSERTVRWWAERLGLGRRVTRSVRVLTPDDLERLREVASRSTPRRHRQSGLATRGRP